MNPLPEGLIEAFLAKADIGHLALFLWASGASLAVGFGISEAAETARRTEAFMQDFLQELARFNQRHGDD
jgi:hypothetical protein